MKRYAIVRVDGKCLSDYENIKCPYDYKCAKCKFGKLKNYNYGDTKEQLVMKIAQAIFRRKLRLYKERWGGTPISTERKYCYENSLKIAKEIVESLGVK